MIWWITGNTGAGKTTLAKKIKGAVLLDGDEMRECWSIGLSKGDRYEHNIRIAKIAKLIALQGFDVVVSTICPYKELREYVQIITKCKFIYLTGGEKPSKKYPYETDI